MKYLEEFRFGDLAKKVLKQIIAETDLERDYHFLDFCTSHAHPIHRYGLTSYLPENLHIEETCRDVKLLLNQQSIQQSLQIAKEPYVLCCSYPELLAQNIYQTSDLMTAKSNGADIRIVYTIDDAINLAKLYPAKHIIFIAVGFEGEMLTTAKALQTVRKQNIHNFSVFIQHKTAFNAMLELLETMPEKAKTATGILLPTDFMENGIAQYHAVQVRYNKPIVISGGEPIDILQSILYLIRQNNVGDHALINQYRHTVATHENLEKNSLLTDVFNNQCDPVTAPICVQQQYMQHTVLFGDNPQVESFFQQESEQDNDVKVINFNPLVNQLQQ